MKKGFTLIELLAVIVILAIIALIAIPIVITIIDDSTDSATLRSGEFYLDAVETAVMKKNMDAGGTFNPKKCLVMSDGNLSCDEDKIKVDVDGEKPVGGSVEFENGEIEDVTLNYSEGITISLDFNRKLIFGEDTLANYIKKLYKETKTTTLNDIEYGLDETNFLMNDRLGNKKVDKTDGNIRYYGANPNNYIDIGDRDSDGNIIFWRIIGVFKDVEVTDEDGNVIKTEDLVKIIRADKLTSGDINKFSWDYKPDVAYSNAWSKSTLNSLLNGAYYNSAATSYYNNSTTPITLNFESTGLSSDARNKVESVKWNLGKHHLSTIYADTMYSAEHSGTNTWPGKVAIISPSDYGYSSDLSICKSTLFDYQDSKCTSTNWNYLPNEEQWTLISYSSNSVNVFYVFAQGHVHSYYGATEAYSVRPVMYLKSNVQIKKEIETSNGIKYFVVE